MLRLSNLQTSNSNWRCVVSIKSTSFKTKEGLGFSKRLRVLKRKSFNYCPIFDQDCIEENAVEAIVNFHEVPDGLYEVVLNSQGFDNCDFLDYWDWKLIPYEE